MIPLGIVASGRHSNVVFTDNFNRADGSLGSNWTDVTALAISSNKVTGSTGSACLGVTVPALPTAAGYAQLTITTGGGGSSSQGVMIRMPGGTTQTGYLWRYSGSGATQLFVVSASTYTAIGSPYSATLTAPFTLRIEAQGSTIRGYVDGVQRQSTTDATNSSGTHAGVRLTGTTVRADDFEMGSL